MKELVEEYVQGLCFAIQQYDKYPIERFVKHFDIGSWHVGDLPDYRMRSTGMKRGYTFNHRARQIELNDFARFDYIIGMDVENMNTLRRMKKQFMNSDEGKGQECAELLCLADFLKHHQGQTTVPDPYYGQQRDFEFALDLIEDACGELFRQLLAGDVECRV